MRCEHVDADGKRCEALATVAETAPKPKLLRRLCETHYLERIEELRALLLGNELGEEGSC